MRITNHHLAKLAGWQRVHYYDLVQADIKGHEHSSNMYKWVQDNVPADRWVSWNGDMWFKNPKDATFFILSWA